MSEHENPNVLPLPCKIGKYKLEKVLGQGGFGYTYLATDTELGRKVAIKELFPAELASRRRDYKVIPRSPKERDSLLWARDRFLDEARTIARFEDEHLVKVHEHFEANDTAYIVMGFVEGCSLNEFMAEHRDIGMETMRAIIAPLLRALESVHQQGFLHRDIKPDNIRITKGSKPVLIDFGAARMAVGQQSHEVTTLLTRSYAPIEQYQENGKLGPWSDIYSLGAVIHKMLRGKTPPEATARIRSDPYQPLARDQTFSHYPSSFLEAVDWMLAPYEEERPQTVAELEAMMWGHQDLSTGVQPAWTPAAVPARQGADEPTLPYHIPEQGHDAATHRSSGGAAASQGAPRGGRRSPALPLALMGMALTIAGIGVWVYGPMRGNDDENGSPATAKRDTADVPQDSQAPAARVPTVKKDPTPLRQENPGSPPVNAADLDRVISMYTTGDQKIFTIRVTQADRDLASKRIAALEATSEGVADNDTITVLQKIHRARMNEIQNLAEDACTIIRDMEGMSDSLLDSAFQARLADLRSNAALKNISTAMQQDALRLFHEMAKTNKGGVKISPSDVSSKTENITIPQ